jgi:aconitate hydratase
MFGMPVMLKIPEVVGVRMRGSLPEGTLATDLALAVTQRLRALPLSGKFVEFFGPGVSTLSCGERAVVANMAPEYGASCGFFAVDGRTLEYLRATGRPDTLVRMVEEYCKRQHLWFEPDAEPRFTEVVEIDLSGVEISLAGPRRPQDRLTPAGTAAAVRKLARSDSAGSGGADCVAIGRGDGGGADSVVVDRGGGGGADSVVIGRGDIGRDGAAGAICASGADVGAAGSDADDSSSRVSLIGSGAIRRNGAVAIAAITSCTNTSDPRLVVAAGLLARKARALGLKPQPWVKTSLAPGSPAAALYLRRSNLLDDLESLGFGIVGYGCTTCIGNSGPLAPAMLQAIEERGITPVAVLSGNRNFPGRVHPHIEASFLASPPLVIAYALAGDVDRDITSDPIGEAADGRAIYLRDLWPTGMEIDAALAASVSPADFFEAYQQAEENEIWRGLDAPCTPLFPWDEKSTYIRRPPFASADGVTRLGSYVAHPLLMLADDITTDHISPAGQVPAGSDAAEYLVARGENAQDLNVFAARRGNWEAMLRGLFANNSVRNLLAPNIPPGSTIHAATDDVLPLRLAAERYHADRESVVVIAGERYGTGSSRDWAAKGLWLLGVRAVLALSFERIHRSNLIGMGILPIVLPERLALTVGDTIAINADPEDVVPRGTVSISIQRLSGKTESLIAAVAVETALEVTLLKVGGILPHILRHIAKGAEHS